MLGRKQHEVWDSLILVIDTDKSNKKLEIQIKRWISRVSGLEPSISVTSDWVGQSVLVIYYLEEIPINKAVAIKKNVLRHNKGGLHSYSEIGCIIDFLLINEIVRQIHNSMVIEQILYYAANKIKHGPM